MSSLCRVLSSGGFQGNSIVCFWSCGLNPGLHILNKLSFLLLSDCFLDLSFIFSTDSIFNFQFCFGYTELPESDNTSLSQARKSSVTVYFLFFWLAIKQWISFILLYFAHIHAPFLFSSPSHLCRSLPLTKKLPSVFMPHPLPPWSEFLLPWSVFLD